MATAGDCLTQLSIMSCNWKGSEDDLSTWSLPSEPEFWPEFWPAGPPINIRARKWTLAGIRMQCNLGRYRDMSNERVDAGC